MRIRNVLRTRTDDESVGRVGEDRDPEGQRHDRLSDGVHGVVASCTSGSTTAGSGAHMASARMRLERGDDFDDFDEGKCLSGESDLEEKSRMRI